MIIIQKDNGEPPAWAWSIMFNVVIIGLLFLDYVVLNELLGDVVQQAVDV